MQEVPEVERGIGPAFRREFHNTFWQPRCLLSEVLEAFGVTAPPILVFADGDELRMLLRLVKWFIESNSPGDATIECLVNPGVRIVFRTPGNHASLFSARLDFLEENSLALHSLLGAYLRGLEHFWKVKWEVIEEKEETLFTLHLRVK